MAAPEVIRIETPDGEFGVVRWRGAPGTPVVFAAHGITANAWSWSTVAQHLEGEIGLVAIDLRGRGTSHEVPAPFGIRQHADDVAAIIERLNASPAVIAGHSMGAYVALAVAERHPSTVADLVLIDGGPALPVPADTDPGEALDTLLGPAIERLQKIWSDRVSYSTMWSEHPAFSNGLLTPDVERYVLSDLVECDGGFRSIVSETAVRTDGTDLYTDQELRGLLDRRQQPVTIVRAETGLMAAPPAFITDEVVARYPQHRWKTVAGANHYSVLIGDPGAAVVADALRTAVNSQV